LCTHHNERLILTIDTKENISIVSPRLPYKKEETPPPPEKKEKKEKFIPGMGMKLS
jgi:hypothetical protein